MEIALGVIVGAILLYAVIRFLFWSLKTTIKMTVIGLSFFLLVTAGAVIFWVWF